MGEIGRDTPGCGISRGLPNVESPLFQMRSSLGTPSLSAGQGCRPLKALFSGVLAAK